jgi:hypothetical protein
MTVARTARPFLILVFAVLAFITTVAGRPPPASATEVLYDFCKWGAVNCTDGGSPVGSLVIDGSGNLYGVASGGGDCPGKVFKLAPNGPGWIETVLKSFCPSAGEGGNLNGTLLLDGAGNRYIERNAQHEGLRRDGSLSTR